MLERDLDVGGVSICLSVCLSHAGIDSRIMATHSIPKIWTKAKVITVEKPGKDPSLAANYRPISLLSVCYKLLERLALQRISPTVDGLLSPDQAGFRKGRITCEVAALTTFIKNGFQHNILKDWRCLSGLNSSI